MNGVIFIVPRGAEERAVRRAAVAATVVAVPAGAGAAALAGDLPAGDVVMLGLCGALRDLRTGDCAIFSDVADAAGREPLAVALVARLQAALPSAALVHGCTLDHVVTRAAERSTVAAAYGAQAIDMEGTHLVRALAARGRAAAIVRVVSDDPRYDLPPIEDAFDAAGAIRPLQLALAFAARPVAAARFIGDVRRSLVILGEVAAAITAAG